MAHAALFARFGFFLRHRFLDPDLCVRVCQELRGAPGVPATVRGGRERPDVVEEDARRVEWVRASESMQAMVHERLEVIRPTLERHFEMPLTRFSKPDFLRYQAGDFYLAHRDRTDDPNAPPGTPRRVSVVTFLNGEGPADDPLAYGGGSLVFIGLLEDPRLRGRGIPLSPEPGLLIAFRSDTVHAVSPVTYGERYTVVSWYS